jgi:hypothetical protein
MLDADIDDFEITAMDLLATEPPKVEDATSWPPLRLAVVSDSAPPPPWPRNDSPNFDVVLDDAIADEEEPVIIVEDDAPLPQAPVRREEYRNLFSRLRSG